MPKDSKIPEYTNSSDISPESIEKSYVMVTDFTMSTFTTFFKEFTTLERNPNIDVIPVYINSHGGMVDAVTAMRDLVKSSQKPVSTMVLGTAMSCGIVLSAAGTKGYRFVSPTSRVMLHEISYVAWGKHDTIKNNVNESDRLNKRVIGDLSEDMGKKRKWLLKEFKKRTNHDWFLDAKNAVKLGVADHIGIPRINFVAKREIPQKTVLIYPPGYKVG